MGRLCWILFAAVCCSALATETADADPRRFHQHHGYYSNIYHFHPDKPRIMGPRYPGYYRYSGLRFHYEHSTIFHGGPYYHVYHGPILHKYNRPAWIGLQPHGVPEPQDDSFNMIPLDAPPEQIDPPQEIEPVVPPKPTNND